MNYLATSEQLTSIANAIRAKGKNLYDGDHSYVLEPDWYTFSADVTFDGSKSYWLTVNKYYTDGSGFMETESLSPKPSAGTVEKCTLSFEYTSSMDSVSFWLVSGLTYENIQLEKGYIPTDYVPHIGALEFPDGFISAINSI